jgi:drug/metabolite transporter (DMT)-like permease
MSIIAAILLIISAATHAGWNFISKKEHPTQAFYLAANTIGVVCVLPILFYHWHLMNLIPLTVWIYAIISGFFLAAYLEALAGSYRSGDISIAYPLARALPVIFVFGFTLFSGKGKPLGVWFIIGAVLVVGGCIILPLKAFRDFQISNYKNLCVVLAVLAAIGISGYTVTDDIALRHLRELAEKPFAPLEGTLIYMVLEGISCSLWQSLFVLLQSRERANFIDVLHNYKGAAATTGIGIYLTYGLVLMSMNFVSNVSYVAAFRQLSVPLGALFGMALLREPRYNPKIIAVTMIFIGLILVVLG